MPSPHAALKRLHALAGEWSGQEVMRPNKFDPEGSTFDSATTSAVGANGFVVTSSTEQHKDGEKTYSGHGVFWHDSESGEVHLHAWDLFGAAPDVFRGTWEGDRLLLVAKNHMGYWRYGFTLGEATFSQTMEQSDDGETWKPLSEASYERRS